MGTRWLARVCALCFALVLVGGGGALPVLDAAFHHSSHDAGSSRLVDPATAPAHDAVCTLGVPVPVAVASSMLAGVEHVVAQVSSPFRSLREHPRAPSRAPLRLPRAPPAPFA